MKRLELEKTLSEEAEEVLYFWPLQKARRSKSLSLLNICSYNLISSATESCWESTSKKASRPVVFLWSTSFAKKYPAWSMQKSNALFLWSSFGMNRNRENLGSNQQANKAHVSKLVFDILMSGLCDLRYSSKVVANTCG